MGKYVTTDDVTSYFDKERIKREIEFNKYLDYIIFKKEHKKVLDRMRYKDIINYLLTHNINNLLDCIPEEILNNYVRNKKINKISK